LIDKAIDCYFEQAKPDGAENSGKPRVVHSGLEIALNGKKANILVLVFANVAQALEVARWMNLLDKGRPAFNIWPPGVRQAQTSETQLKVFKAYWDKTKGEVDTGVRELVSLSEGQGTVLEGWRARTKSPGALGSGSPTESLFVLAVSSTVHLF
jgi:hypothetical protein